MSNRLEKVNSLLKREVSNIIARDFNFHGTLVTLTRMETTANLIEAKAYISVLLARQSLGDGGHSSSAKASADKEDKTGQIIKVLNSNVYDIQQKINKKLNMRPIPKIRFVKDPIIAEAANIEKLLSQLKKEEK